MPLIIDDGPCETYYAMQASFQSSQEKTDRVEDKLDDTQIGLIVFLVIFFVFTSLTSGLLVCLTKIWCCKGEQRTIISTGGEKMSEKRKSDLASSQDEESDSDSDSGQHTPRVLLTTRVMDFVQRSFRDRSSSKRANRKKSTTPSFAPAVSITDSDGVLVGGRTTALASPSPTGTGTPRIWDGSESPTPCPSSSRPRLSLGLPSSSAVPPVVDV
ncbi:hypothetical protein PRIPAC_72728 [Pristionchus pacificus]|uniref:Uncharacterized protein n=1 Tax=Pristionchus pacificus TaxID=54126 RepID=A0A2A6CF19_PRIPA|nr:hypothetical protein PRIPAC_72728 [Pristionchus pacificus]|eukprot:PDM76792.1 hypothetical protein PRIPAC_42187 [Pristionchus pacificus]